MQLVLATWLLLGCAGNGECEGPLIGESQVPESIVAQWSGGELTLAAVESRLESELRAMAIEHAIERHERMESALDALVDEALLEAEARDRGLDSVDELLVMEVEERVPPLDESAIQRMYPDIERENPGLTLEEARPRIERGLRRRSHADRYRVFIEELRSKSAVEQRLPYPELPRVPVVVTEHDPILGPVDAPVTVVQFAEYECFYCTQMQPVIDRVRQQWPDQVRVVFKDFPLTGHGRAVPAAVAAHCAGEQGRFWSFHQEMMSNQGAVSERDLTEHATVTGLDPERFAACRSSGRHEAGIFDDLAMGREHGVRATPTFFINGTLLAGMQSFERLEDVIRRELR